jgi:MSHA pilin protein MshC
VKGFQAKKNTGFTLVELIMVMVLVGIMAAVALPKMSNVMSTQSPGYRDQMMASINYARKIAVSQRRHVCVSITSTAVTLTADPALPVNHTNGNCPNSLALPLGGNVVTAPKNVTASPAVAIDFDAQGRPVTGAPATITITDASTSQTPTLTIEAESGYVH